MTSESEKIKTAPSSRGVCRLGIRPGEYIYGEPVSNPIYSICIPTYSRPDMLREAVASAAGQYFDEEWEIIVCENSRDAETLRVLTELGSKRVRLWRNSENIGMVANWNQCIALAAGAWVSILHDDDLLSPWFLRECAQIEARSTVPCALFGRSLLGASPPHKWDMPASNTFVRITQREFCLNNPISFPGVCFRRDTAVALDGFDPVLVMAADYDFWSRLSAAGEIWRSSEYLSFYRISAQQCSSEAVDRLVNDFNRVQARQLAAASCSAIGTWVFMKLSGILIEGYYRRTYGRSLSAVFRIKLRLAPPLRRLSMAIFLRD